ncbi:Pilus assembly protein, PilP [Tepidimonas thermarum]|uniref:Pilus assembly protein, PilP n=1 Tax=Tepidimonas thermarum TaxID=335431 RepID=A0A554X6V3_9BURK|nr:pilus assembly protein PilP [Tepidimonas thermarum]TSE31564.1 Pilus assembly protein, PilP [Tepidimonas thermarum]
MRGHTRVAPPLTWTAALVVGVLVLGCSGAAQDDLTQWMAQQRAGAQPKVQPIQPPLAYQPQAYVGIDALSPFSDEKLTRVLRSDSATAGMSRLLEAEMRRRREPLEEFPLDTMAMVGLLDRGGQRVALVRVNGMLYAVRPGHYLGQNFGRVTAITDNQITLREIVQDAAGEWIERTATLQLQEGTGK